MSAPSGTMIKPRPVRRGSVQDFVEPFQVSQGQKAGSDDPAEGRIDGEGVEGFQVILESGKQGAALGWFKERGQTPIFYVQTDEDAPQRIVQGGRSDNAETGLH